MIAKNQLIDGRYYQGHCRNTTVAVWDKRANCFYHLRSKFGWRLETIQHEEDAVLTGFDGFVPYKEIETLYQDPTP